MSSQIIWPHLNPLAVYNANQVDIPQYLTKHLHDTYFSEHQHDWKEHSNYVQKWQLSDTIKLQFKANFSGFQLSIINYRQTPIITAVPARSMTDTYNPGFFAYEYSIALNSLAPGRYWALLTTTAGDKFISEPFDVKAKWPGTLYNEYTNNRFHGDVIFQTGIKFGLRVEGTIEWYNPKSTDTRMMQQSMSPLLLSSRPYSEQVLKYGKAEGIPDWLAYKLNWVWSCNSVEIDGKSFAKAEGATWEAHETDFVNTRGWSFSVQEGVNRGSKIMDSANGTVQRRLAIAFGIEGRLFGDLAGQSNIITVQTI